MDSGNTIDANNIEPNFYQRICVSECPTTGLTFGEFQADIIRAGTDKTNKNYWFDLPYSVGENHASS